MTDKPDDGGPAFGCSGNPNEHGIKEKWQEGMTLLDWFAGQTSPAIIQMLIEALKLGKSTGGGFAKRVSKDAYEVADAMIAEKRRREGK